VRTRFSGCDHTLLDQAKERFWVEAPFGGPTSSGMLTLRCPPSQIYGLASFLREQGAQAVSVADIDYLFAQDNPLYQKLESGLSVLDR
jgi:ATP phosphoribosyltransferase